MREWIVATLIALSLIKVFSLGDGRSTLQIGMPWLLPFDSPAAACVRSPDQPLIECGVGASASRKQMALTVADLPKCQWCLETSIWLSSFGRDRQETDRRLREIRSLAE